MPAMHIAMLGTRGVPARYGGFETAVEEIGRRLVAVGHRVSVYCRGDVPPSRDVFGMEAIRLPALRVRSLETLTHTGVSVAHALLRARPDVAFVFNAANAPYVPVLQAGGVRCALHTDGLEWQRGKWGRVGRAYYRRTERLGARHAHALISDHPVIARYYRERYRRDSEVIAYGADVISPPPEALATLDLTPGEYYLVVARLEPENHVDVIVRGYAAARTDRPLVVVGSAPYPTGYQRDLHVLADRDPRVRMLGALWDERIDVLYAHAAAYLHGHSVGGTNPSLLRAMGAGAPVAVWDVEFNRYVLGHPPQRCRFRTPPEVTRVIEDVAADPAFWKAHGQAGQRRVAECYRWDDVAAAYLRLALRLTAASSTGAGRPSGRGASRG